MIIKLNIFKIFDFSACFADFSETRNSKIERGETQLAIWRGIIKILLGFLKRKTEKCFLEVLQEKDCNKTKARNEEIKQTHFFAV